MGILVSIDQAADRERFGGKSANLAFLSRLGLNVPAGRIVPADEFVRHVAACGTEHDLTAAIGKRALSAELGAELRALVQELGGRVSVRSSATLEDAKTHSFAGQFLTVLNVGVDGVEDAVRAVWASAFSDNVRAYLRRADLDAAKLRMAVVVQRQINSETSGVAIGKPGGVIVEAVFGQGEALVSGSVVADQWDVDGGKIAKTTIARKTSYVTLPAGSPTGSLSRVELEPARRTNASLTDAQALEVASTCMRIAASCDGRPQDCEFAFADGKLHLLQTRDVTASVPISAPPLAEFVPPGKGAWELEASHFQRPSSRMFQSIFPAAMKTGFQKSSERYGALLSHVDFAFVNGFAYTRLRPVAAPEDAASKPPPPAFIFKLLCKLVPALRRRIRNADRMWKNREWQIQLEEWKVDKARAITEHRRLQAVDLDSLDDAALAKHFGQVREHVRRMVAQHHSYNLAVMIPMGDLLAHVARWTDGKVTASAVCAALTGASPMSAELTSDEARRLGAALAAHPEARQLLRLDVADAVLTDHAAQDALARIRVLDGDVGTQTRDFLAMREFRLVEGLDPAAPSLRECPLLLWQALRSTALSPAATASTADADALTALRAAVPADKHAELDTLVTEARSVALLRDERALFSDVWAWGILRTTVLAMGRRLIRRSAKLLCDPGDLLHASADEALSLLTQSQGPSAIELETRGAHWRSYTLMDAPRTLGPKQLPPPSSDLLPPGAARVMDAVSHILPHIIAPPSEKSDAGMRGAAASGGVWEGPAHVVTSHDDAKDIPVGAVLVVGSGSSTFTMLAPLASAVVSEGGGLLSHVAIVCREYRIPCVTGVAEALSSVQNGQRLRVDGTRGTVEVIAS